MHTVINCHKAHLIDKKLFHYKISAWVYIKNSDKLKACKA
jgi:hypothetical protein